jgi:aryl-alcohol dehydrogenase-like predicted oxidoreductase
MKYRKLGKTNFEVSEISLGTWQIGGVWGSGFEDALADRLLDEAIDQGVNFIDTADVYEGGKSEQAVGRALKRHSNIMVATKCGRQLNPHTNEAYTTKALRAYVEESLTRLQTDCLDLIQLHCPPTEVYYRPEIFGLFEDLQQEGKIKHLGVSVEKVEEAIKAIEFDNVATVQIIYNIFRQRPNDLFFDLAQAKNVGVIVRVPLASGLLSGKYTQATTFGEGDHRHGNRNGEWFDKGETFAGVPYELGLIAVEKLKAIFPHNDSLASIALKWILMNPKISVVIPGATKASHLASNIQTSALPDISASQLTQVQAVYDEMIKPLIHQLW